MFRHRLDETEGLLITEPLEGIAATSINILFVFVHLGIVWINSAGIVVGASLAKPFDLLHRPPCPARHILEVHPSRLAEFAVGDKIMWSR